MAEETRYESTYIIKGSLQDPEIDAIITKVEDFITRTGGKLIETERWGRRKLAYEIDRETQGFYVSAHILGGGSLISKLERHYHLDESIVRWLTLVMPESAVKGRVAMKKRTEDMTARRDAMAAAAAAEAAA